MSWLNASAAPFVPAGFQQPAIPPPCPSVEPAQEQPVEVEDDDEDNWLADKQADIQPPQPAAQAKPKPPKVPEPSPTEPTAPEVAAVSAVPESAGEVIFNDDIKAKLLKKGLPAPDPRPHLNVVFIGHVDAGKSTTCGNILYLTGRVDSRTIEKYEREAKEKGRDTWFYAFILDINEEERQRGKTTEVGRATFDLPTTRFTILDAPGHKGLVPDMLQGAAQADVAVLIISARKGEFETGFDRGGQTREHAMLAKTLGVNSLIVAVNKMDDPTCEWSQERYDDICKKVGPYLKSCGFNPAKDVHFVPIAGLSGQNLKEHVSDSNSKYYTPNAAWYPTTMPTLLQKLESMELPPRDETGPLRVPLLEGFRDGAVSCVGKVESGVAFVDQTGIILPAKLRVKIIGVKEEENDLAYAKPGENVELQVVGCEEGQIRRGSVLSSLTNMCPVVTKFTAQAVIVSLLEHKPILTSGYTCVLHIHTACEEVEVEKLLTVIDPATKKKNTKPAFVKANQHVTFILKTTNAVCVETYADRPQMGRFTLRDEGRTIAIGKVIAV